MQATLKASWSTRFSHVVFERYKYWLESILGFQEGTIILPEDRSTVSLSSRGRGKPLVFLHGFASDRTCWSLMLPFLNNRHRIILIDLPGWGKSSYSSHFSYTPLAQANRLESVRKLLKIESWHLVGISMGAAIAGLYAAQFPRSTQTLTLLNAAGLSAEKGQPTVDSSLLVDNPLLVEKSKDIHRLWQHVFFRQPLLTKLFSGALEHSYIQRQEIQRKLFNDLIEHPDALEKKISNITCPTQIVWGLQDRLIDVSCLYRAREMRPDFRYYVLDNCGHLPILEKPWATARLINEWLQNFEERSSRQKTSFSRF